MRYSLLWDFAQRRLVVSDVSEQPVRPIFKGPASLAGCLETSISNFHSTLRNVPEEQRLQNTHVSNR